MKRNQGFTLMEILAVLLVIAVIASFAVPLIKSVRREIRYQRAKSAGVQLAEAVRSFYTDAKGCFKFDTDTTNGFTGTEAAAATCPNTNPISTGSSTCEDADKAAPTAVFGCNYLSAKMFVDLPYRFTVLNPRASDNDEFIIGTENVGSGNVGSGARQFVIYRDMTIRDLEEE